MRSLLALILFVPFLAAAGQEAGLTLDEAIATGLRQSRTLRASAARVDAAEARAGEARTARLPMIRADASYRRLSEVDPFRVQLPFSPQPIEISPVVLDNSQVRVGFQQPLFTGFRISSAIEGAERGADAATLDHAHDRAELVFAVTSAYWALYQTREGERFAGENVGRLERALADVRRLMAAGLATKNDLLKVEVQLSNGRLALVDAENDARLAAMNLNTLLGRPVDMPVTVLSQPDDPGVRDHAGAGMLTSRALQQRPDLQAYRTRVEASKAGVAAARSGWWPQLALSGNYLYARPNSRYMPTRDEFKGTWDVGVVLTMDVWNWGLTARQTEQAEAALRQQEALEAQMEDMVALEVNRATQLLDRAVQRAALAGTVLGQAEEQARVVEERFRTGMATATDLLDAEVALHQAKLTRSGALVEYAVARARMERTLGTPVR